MRRTAARRYRTCHPRIGVGRRVSQNHTVSVVRMYIQMIVVGLVLSGLLYAALIGGFLSRFVGGPIPEVRTVDGQPHLVTMPAATRLPVLAIVK